MNNGWIKLHRKILDNPIHLRGEWFSVWIHLLLLASHEGHSFIWNGQKQYIKSGQFLTGRKELAKICGVSSSLVERVLKYLEIEQQIEQQKTTKYRIITILNWDKYQNTDSKSDNKRTTNGQQTDTYKNDKNVRRTIQSDESQNLNPLINLFEGVNPTYERLFSNKTERGALQRLVDKFGIEKITSTIKELPNIINQPYAPRITTPYELERNLAKLIAFVNQNKTLSVKKSSNVI